MYIILYLSFAGQLRERMWKRFVLRTVTESDNQLVYTTNNYHFVIFTNIRCANVNDNVSFDRFFQEQTFLNKFSENNANWDDSFIVPPGCNYEGPPWTGKGHRQIQVVRNDRGLMLLPLLEAAPGHLHSYLLLSERRYCDTRLTVLNKK